MEEKIYERQIMKQSLSQRVVDEHQIERHFSSADLQELYSFRPDKLDAPNREEKTLALPKVRIEWGGGEGGAVLILTGPT